jgi:hypothetical protein
MLKICFQVETRILAQSLSLKLGTAFVHYYLLLLTYSKLLTFCFVKTLWLLIYKNWEKKKEKYHSKNWMSLWIKILLIENINLVQKLQ